MANSLEDRMAAATSAGAPSMVPDWNPPPAKTEEVIPTLQELVTDPKDYLQLKRLCLQHREYGAMARDAAKALKPCTARIKVLLSKYKVGKALDGDTRINFFGGWRKSLSTAKLRASLLSQGVLPHIIEAAVEAATDSKPSYTLRITEVGQTEDDEAPE